MKTRIHVAILFGFILALSIPAQAQSTNTDETLKQYVASLQANPHDLALREKIIRLAADMNPPPEIPAEAKRYMSRGLAAMEDAKTEADFKDAANEFSQAVNMAPWLGVGYRDLAIAADKAGDYDRALRNLGWYLLSKPAPADADWANDLKAKIEYRKEKAAKETEAAAQDARAKADSAAREKAKQQQIRDVAAKFEQIVGGRTYYEQVASIADTV